MKCSLLDHPSGEQHKLPHPCATGSRARQELWAVLREAGHAQEQIQPMVPGKSFYFSASRARWHPAERRWSRGVGAGWWQGEDSIVPMSLLGQSPAPGLPLWVQEPCCLCCASVSGLAAVPPSRGTDLAQGWSQSCSLLHCSRGAAPPSPAAMGHGGIFAPSPSSSSSPGVKLSREMLPSPAFSCPLAAPCSLQLTSSRASPDVLSSRSGGPSSGPSPLLGGPKCEALFA